MVTCSVCGLVTNQETPPLGHDFSIGHTDGDMHYHNCSRCDATDNGENIEYELYVENYREVWFIGQVFELTGASASVKCVACGEETAVDIQEVVTDGGAFEEACEKKTVVCTYGEYTFTVVVTVKEKTLESVAVATGDDTENKYDYAIGEEFAGGKLTLSFDDGSVEYADLTADMLDDFSTSAIGVYTVYVDYEDKLCSFEIRVGFDKEAGAYKLEAEKGIFKVQVEDENYVDMSGAVLQTGAASKFENTTNLSDGSVAPNGAEGFSTSNISVKDNKIVIRFASDVASKFRLGIRAQSGSGSGKQDQPIDKAFRVTVNGEVQSISGLIKRASTGSNNWKDMFNWTLLDDIAGEIQVKKGLNEIEFYYLGETSTLRLPNIDYFTLWIYEDVRLEVSGEVEVSKGASYEGGLTLTIKDGDDVIKTMPVSADMISGLDSTTAGVKTVTVSYGEYTATCNITVLDTQVLSIKGGAFAGGATSVTIKAGEPIPEITWTAENVLGYTFNGSVYKTAEEIAALTMCNKNATITAVTMADLKVINLPTGSRFCNALDDNGKPGSNNVAANPAEITKTEIYAANDAVHLEFGVDNAEAKGVTLMGNVNFGSGETFVFVTIKNNGATDIADAAYGTECGKVGLGSVAAGETVAGFAVINADGANHWTSVVWGDGQTAVNMNIAVYVCSLA